MLLLAEHPEQHWRLAAPQHCANLLERLLCGMALCCIGARGGRQHAAQLHDVHAAVTLTATSCFRIAAASMEMSTDVLGVGPPTLAVLLLSSQTHGMYFCLYNVNLHTQIHVDEQLRVWQLRHAAVHSTCTACKWTCGTSQCHFVFAAVDLKASFAEDAHGVHAVIFLPSK